jgi:phage tail-like protein
MADQWDARPSTGYFIFTVDDLEIGTFGEVRGLEVTMDVEELHEGGQNQFVHRLPGRLRWPNIELVRGIVKADNLFEWMQRCAGEGFERAGSTLTRSTAAITVLSMQGKPLRSWELSDAFPVHWSGPRFASGESDSPVEHLEITHHGFKSRNH